MFISEVNSVSGNQIPGPVRYLKGVMAPYSGRWALCGGWAVDAWLGRESREHHDLDVAVIESDLPSLREHFDGWQLWAHDFPEDNNQDQWTGRALKLPAHIHARQADQVEVDIQINAASDSEIVLWGDPGVTLSRDAAFVESRWSLPTLAPEAILFFKAQDLRPRDEADFAALFPLLTSAQRHWLSDAIARVQPGHDWLQRLIAER